MNESNRNAPGKSRASQKIRDLMAERTAGRIGSKLLVMSGKGGVGKSSLAAGLALALAERRFRVGLLDVDLHGPSIAGILGLQGPLQMTEDRFAVPRQTENGLKVVSMQFLLADPDRPVIWRGPAKTSAVRQFMADVQWGELDFLLIDSPPGTGDEPLAVSRSVAGARAVVVTTPQQVALDDVRRSIRFCRTVSLPIMGLIENMAPFCCPHCGRRIELFNSAGGRRLAEEEKIPFIGSLPFDPKVAAACDAGRLAAGRAGEEYARAMAGCVERVVKLTTNA